LPIERPNRRLTTILAADAVGYSRLVRTDEEGTLKHLRTLRKDLIDPMIAAHRGRIVKTTGDGFLVEYASVVDAVRSAVEMQRAMADSNAGLAPDKRIEFRVGINLGDIIVEGRHLWRRSQCRGAPGNARRTRRDLHLSDGARPNP